MGWSPCQAQLPAWVPERMWQHCGRCPEPDPYPPRPGHGEIVPRWNKPRSHPKGRMSWPHSSWGRPWCGKRGMCHCRADVGPNTHDWLGRSPEKRFSAEHHLRLPKAQKKTDMKMLLGEHASSEEGQLILWNCQNFMIHQKALYVCSMPKGENEDLLLFMVPKAHWVATMKRCHRDAGHQGHDHTLSLLQAVLLVDRDDQSDEAIYQDLHVLLSAWGQLI